jgi:hypothetical protein
VFEILLSDPKVPMEAVPDHIQLAARPAKLPDLEAYHHISDLMLLPGRQPGQALVDAHARNLLRGVPPGSEGLTRVTNIATSELI